MAIPLFKRPGKSYDSVDKFKAGAAFFYGQDNIEFIQADDIFLAAYIRKPEDPNESITDKHRKLIEQFKDDPIGIFNTHNNRGKIIKEDDNA